MVAAAIVGGAVVSAGASAYSANKQAKAAGAAGQAGAAASEAAVAEQRRQYDQTRADFADYRDRGISALDRIGLLYGFGTPQRGGYFDAAQYLRDNPDVAADDYFGAKDLQRPVTEVGGRRGLIAKAADTAVRGSATPESRAREHWDKHGQYESWRKNPFVGGTPGRAAGAPDMSVFFESPDYQFNLAEGQKAIDRSLAARGRSLSGAGVKEGIRYASGMASNEFGNFYNRLASIAGIGQAATNSTATAGMNAANQTGAAMMYGGNARASAYLNQGQAAANMAAGINNATQGGISNYLLYQYLNKSPQTPPYAG